MRDAPEIAGARVLLVEDEALIAEELRERLRRLQLVVVGVADTAATAIELAESLRPDLVLLDIRLKGEGDGHEVAAKIAPLEIPVVYLTAHSDPATLARGLATAPYGYLVKPVDERSLFAALSSAITRSTIDRQLRVWSTMHEATLESLADGVVATDLTGRILFMNVVAEEVLGVTADAGRGQLLASLASFRLESGEALASLTERALAERQRIAPADRIELVRRDGSVVAVGPTAAPVANRAGDALGAVLVLRDLRAQRRAEAALAASREQVARAQRLEQLGLVASSLAHDFNNLLTIINSSCDLARGAAADVPSLLDDIQQSCQRGAGLVRQLLDYGRPRSVDQEVFELNTRLRGLERLIAGVLSPGATLELQLGDEALWVRGDAAELERAVINLVLNARDSMPGGGQVRLATAQVELASGREVLSGSLAPGTYARVVTADTGRGLTEAQRSRLFEPFFTTKELGRGSGLGMASVAAVVEKAGGQVEVLSSPGGTAIELYLPFAAAPHESAVETRVAQVAPAAARILLVDDEEFLRSALRRLLEREGFRVVEAANGTAALELLEADTGPIDLVLSDVVMPGMSGIELVQHVRALRPQIRLILMSAFADHELERHGLSSATVPLLRKPFSRAELASMIQQQLGPPSKRTGLEAQNG
jgi:two-component system cell cycle sensor histidine kinase/response regulator CckA